MGFLLKFLLRTVKWFFIVFCIFVLSLFFRMQRVPGRLVAAAIDAFAPTNIIVHVESVSFGFLGGLHVRNLRLYDRDATKSVEPVMSASALSVFALQRRVVVDDLTYIRLPPRYYMPGNEERNSRAELPLPNIGRLSLVLRRPNVLSMKPEKVTADVEVSSRRIAIAHLRLDWPDADEQMWLEGSCSADFERQEVVGEVRGSAKQHHARPFLVALDLPSALPYVDAFTDILGKVPVTCRWKVNLVNNDFNLDLWLSPDLGKYNGVPMRHAEGNLHFSVYTRGHTLNYRHVIGPISATGVKGEPLNGTIVVDSRNGTNTVSISAKSALPAADILKIGGFVGDYVGEDVIGKSECELEFKFPWDMGDDRSKLNGRGSFSIRDGQVMRMKGFNGLLSILADKVPGVAWFTDSTQAFCDYTIEDGIVKSDNVYIEGSVFSIKMYGSYDSVRDSLNFTARVQFSKKDSLVGRVLHPLTWPFTKLLLEFRLSGTTENPKWTYISVIDRVLESTR